MSLINDALKRAQSQQSGGHGPKPPRPQEMRPVVASRKSSSAPLALVLLLLLCLAGGGWFFWKWFQKKQAEGTLIVQPSEPVESAEAAPVIAKTETSPANSKSEAATKEPKNEETKPKTAAASEVKSNTPATSAPHSSSDVVASTPKPEPRVRVSPRRAGPFPNFKLQGIFYSPTKPAVILNGRSLYVGEAIQGAEVMEITPNSVTLDWNGVNHVLELNR